MESLVDAGSDCSYLGACSSNLLKMLGLDRYKVGAKSD